MLNLVKACAPWLNWKSAAVIALVAFGVAFCLGMRALGLLAGAAPLLLMLACLIPCLIPLALLRRRGPDQAAATRLTIPLAEQPGQAAASCGCGKDSCGVGDGPSACWSEAAAR
jgi:hypothetical protein